MTEPTTSPDPLTQRVFDLVEDLFPGEAEQRPGEAEFDTATVLLGAEVPRNRVSETNPDITVWVNRAGLRTAVRRHLVARLPSPEKASIVAAETIAAAVAAKFIERADLEHPSDWSSMQAGGRYVALLCSGTAHAPAPRTVIAQVSGPDVDIWGYAASEILDAAAARFGLPDTSIIQDDGEEAGRYRLTW